MTECILTECILTSYTAAASEEEQARLVEAFHSLVATTATFVTTATAATTATAPTQLQLVSSRGGVQREDGDGKGLDRSGEDGGVPHLEGAGGNEMNPRDMLLVRWEIVHQVKLQHTYMHTC